MGKEENKYAKEYINHYKNLGYNHIFLYDNNELNGEKFEDVLKEEIAQGFVSIINFRGTKKERWEVFNLKYIMIVMKKIIKNLIGFLFLILMNF